MTATISEAVHAGWYLLAFTDELEGELTPVSVGRRALMLVRDDAGELGLYDATCPHRGSNLAYGGRLDRGAVVCPFHGKRIQLGACERPWWVARHPVAVVGPMVLGRIRAADAADGTAADPRADAAADRALATLRALVDGMLLRRAVRTPVRAPSALVIENAFDADHFSVVHGIPAVTGMTARPHPDGHLTVEAQFRTVASPWLDAQVSRGLQAVLGSEARRFAADVSPFRAAALSPGLVVSRLGTAPQATVIVTGAVPHPDGGSTARVAVGAAAEGAALERVLDGARRALAQDVEVWDHIDHDAPHRYDVGDEPVLAFQEFCAGFPLVGTAPPAVRAAG
jgi:3-ketosteroid 9alpha-monooxygenase subunit A